MLVLDDSQRTLFVDYLVSNSLIHSFIHSFTTLLWAALANLLSDLLCRKAMGVDFMGRVHDVDTSMRSLEESLLLATTCYIRVGGIDTMAVFFHFSCKARTNF